MVSAQAIAYSSIVIIIVCIATLSGFLYGIKIIAYAMIEAIPSKNKYRYEDSINIKYCNYPECNCPIDLGPGELCLRGYWQPTNKKTKKTITCIGCKDEYIPKPGFAQCPNCGV